MWKKILYIGFVVIFGLVCAMATYYSSMINHIYDTVASSVTEERYADVTKAFTPFYDENEVVACNSSDALANFYVYSAVSSQDLTKDETSYVVYEFSYSLVLVNIAGSVNFDDVMISSTETVNHSSLVFKNGDKSYAYPLVSTETDNAYNLLTTYSKIKCVQTTIAKSTIDQELGGKISSIELHDAEDTSVVSQTCNLNFSETFFDSVSEMVTKYNATEMGEMTNDAFNTYAETFLANYSYQTGYSQSELYPSSLIWKTVGIMAIFTLLVVVLYFLIFKRDWLMRRKPTKQKEPLFYPRRDPKEKTVDLEEGKDFTVKDAPIEEAKPENKE